MKQTFHSTGFGRQTLTVDDDGVREFRRDREIEFIPWEEIESLRRGYVLDIRGRRITMRLGEKTNREFYRCASEIWRQQYPDRWLLNWKRCKRILQWATYLWFPLITFLPLVLTYAFLWILGWPKQLEENLHKLNRVSIFCLFVIIMFVMFVAFRIRRTEKKMANDKSGTCT